jgi:class 3 adenylate cyclase
MTRALGTPGEWTDRNDAEGFDHWLTSKSFSLLVPMCRIGLIVVAVILLVVDPILYTTGIWGAKPQHLQLVIWHTCALLYFLAFHRVARSGETHAARTRCLIAFFVVGAALFLWFALVSWMLSGDLSTYAIFLLTMVCVFGFPGHVRQVINVTSTLALTFLIFWFDRNSAFYANGAIINLAALAVASLLIDGYLMNLNRALYREKQRVEFERARADRVLYNALPMSIANELKSNNVVRAQKHQHMAVLFVDIVGFTRFAATRPPDTVVQVLNEIFSEFDTLVDRYQVEKIKTIGDAYMAVGKGNLAAVANLALEMQASMATYRQRTGFNLAIRSGIHVGPTIAGVIGLKRFLYDVWGDAVNIASRMESLGEAGEIQVSEQVFKELEQSFLFQTRGAIHVKGKGAMRTYFLKARPSGGTISASASSKTPSGQQEYADSAV